MVIRFIVRNVYSSIFFNLFNGYIYIYTVYTFYRELLRSEFLFTRHNFHIHLVFSQFGVSNLDQKNRYLV